MKEETKLIIIMFIGLAAMFMGGYLWSKAGCESKGRSFEGVEYSITGGCMVKHQGKWLPLENIRGFNDN